MPTYHVKWEIDIEADSAEEAAAQALIIQRDNDPDNTATVFTVQEHGTSEAETVDLDRAILVDALLTALPYVEDALDDPAFKPGAVKKHVKQVRNAVGNAEGQED